MRAVKHELGASFPLAPRREEEWGGFPPHPSAAWWEHRARGPSRDARSPIAAPGKALGVPKSRSGQGRGSRGLCFPSAQLQLGGGRRSGGEERGCFGTNRLRFCNVGSGRVSRPQRCPGLGLSPLHVSRGWWSSRTWLERLRVARGPSTPAAHAASTASPLVLPASERHCRPARFPAAAGYF